MITNKKTNEKLKRGLVLILAAISLSSCGNNKESSSDKSSSAAQTTTEAGDNSSEELTVSSYRTDNPLINKAIELLEADGIKAVEGSAKLADVSEDDIDEILLTGEAKDGSKHLYCFLNNDGEISSGVECEGFNGENYTLEWYNTGKFLNAAAHVTTETDDILYDLVYANGKFRAGLLTKKHTLPDGTAEYEMGGRTSYTDAKEDYYYKRYYTWENKEQRSSHALKLASDNYRNGILYDMDGDCYPEFITAEMGLDDTIFYDVYRLNESEAVAMDYVSIDGTGDIRRYYDEENDEYFCISESESYSGSSANIVTKTVFHHNSSYSEEIAVESYCYSENGEKVDKIFLESCRFMGEELDGQRYVQDDNLKIYSKKLEDYLSNYTLVDTIKLSDIEKAALSEDMRSENEAQMAKIEEAYFKNPEEALKKAVDRRLLFDDQYIDRGARFVQIEVFDGKVFDEAEFKKLSELKNLSMVYVYKRFADADASNVSFDLDLLNVCADKITELSFHNVEIETSKLHNFKNLNSLQSPYIGNNEDIKEIAKLKGIVDFRLEVSFENADLSPLAALTDIEYLSIDEGVENMDFVKDMKKLRCVYFFSVSDDVNFFNELAKLPQLKVIAYSAHNVILTDEYMACFKERDDMFIHPLT